MFSYRLFFVSIPLVFVDLSYIPLVPSVELSVHPIMAEELTFEKQTIESFVSLLSFCLQSDPFTDDYVKLVLAGRIDDNQAVISPSTLCLVKNEPFIKRRHYDAIIGISNRIDFDRDITINPFLSNWRTLTRNIHLTHEIYTSEVRFSVAPLELAGSFTVS